MHADLAASEMLPTVGRSHSSRLFLILSISVGVAPLSAFGSTFCWRAGSSTGLHAIRGDRDCFGHHLAVIGKAIGARDKYRITLLCEVELIQTQFHGCFFSELDS